MVSYIEAAARVRDLLPVSPTAIKDLRRIESAFKKMNAETFKAAGLNVDRHLVELLFSDFNRGEA